MHDWIWPRWRELLVAIHFTGVLAAATGAYPMVIKLSFDTLMKGDVTWLPWVLVAIIYDHRSSRSVFLYLQTVATQRIVLQADCRHAERRVPASHLLRTMPASTRDTPGRLMSKLTNDVGFIQQAVLACLNTVVRDTLCGPRARRRHVLSRLGDLAHRARRLSVRGRARSPPLRGASGVRRRGRSRSSAG